MTPDRREVSTDVGGSGSCLISSAT
jgi:hypothetical protein